MHAKTLICDEGQHFTLADVVLNRPAAWPGRDSHALCRPAVRSMGAIAPI